MEHIKATFGPALFRNKEKQETPEKKGAKLLYDYSRLSEHIIKLHTGCENIYTKSEVISLPLSHRHTHTGAAYTAAWFPWLAKYSQRE